MRRYSKLNLLIIIIIILIIAIALIGIFILFFFKNKKVIDNFSNIKPSSFSENIEYINIKFYYDFNRFKNKLHKNKSYLFDEKLYIDNKSNIYTINTDDINKFVLNVLPTINHNFVLICGDRDDSPSKYNEYINVLINDKNCLQIFCQNLDLINGKIKPIPLGIDYHSLYLREEMIKKWSNKNKLISPEDQEVTIINIKNSLKHPFNREAKAYTSSNLNCSDNPSLHKYGGHREKIKILFENSDCVKLEKNKIIREETWQKHNDYLFI